MRPLLALCACATVVAAADAPAHAGPRRTLEAVALRKKPGEKAVVVARLAVGADVTVLGIDGRWLRVRAAGAEGFLARTTVSPPEPGDPDAVFAPAAPSGQWSAALRATAGDGWIGRVQTATASGAVTGEGRGDPRAVSAGAAGDRRAVSAGAAGGATGGLGAASADAPGGRGAPARFAVRAELGVGFRALGMDLTSNAEGGLASYALDAGAVAATLDVDAALRLGGAVFAALDARASASDSSPGIAYAGPTAPPGMIAFRALAADAGARLGLRVHGAFDLALRAGGHYDAFVTARVANAGMLPRERLLGATLGARADIGPAGSRFSATARFDALVIGGRRQTEGLEDGTASTARALWGGLTLRCQVAGRFGAFAGYDLGRATTEWSGASLRQPGATRTRRIDTAQLLQIGISTEL